MNSRRVLYSLLIAVAVCRLLLQVAAMPPYAGLDELYHVAFLAFVVEEGRAPTTMEPSIPEYLYGSIRQQPSSLPSFAEIGERWPSVVKQNPDLIAVPHSLVIRTYKMRNYEAQQPQAYYRLVAPLVNTIRDRSPVNELRLWRLISALFALIAVIATAVAGERLFGIAGLLGAVVLVSLPTWLTLVIRVANDSLTCALVAVAFAVTVAAPRETRLVVLEGLLWALAAAMKLYAWPVLIVLPLMWWRQHATRRRVIIVAVLVAISVCVTLLDLSARTRNPLGVVAFDRPGSAALASRIDLGELVTVTIASGAWTSGQHWNALTPLGIAITFGPLVAGIGIGLLVCRRESRGLITVSVAMVLTFAAAQAFNTFSSLLARGAGNPVPIGGKEGWYWYVLAPIVLAIVLPTVASCRPRLAVMVAVWTIGVDVLVHEFALHHDYAGTSSVSNPSFLFRWGPLSAELATTLEGVAVGPLAGGLTILRGLHVVSVAVFLVSWWNVLNTSPGLDKALGGRRAIKGAPSASL